MMQKRDEAGLPEIRGKLKLLTKSISQAEIARRVGIKPPLISNVLRGKARPSGKLLRWLGFERVIVYRRVR